jgi:hypothetical protein
MPPPVAGVDEPSENDGLSSLLHPTPTNTKAPPNTYAGVTSCRVIESSLPNDAAGPLVVPHDASFERFVLFAEYPDCPVRLVVVGEDCLSQSSGRSAGVGA